MAIPHTEVDSLRCAQLGGVSTSTDSSLDSNGPVPETPVEDTPLLARNLAENFVPGTVNVPGSVPVVHRWGTR